MYKHLYSRFLNANPDTLHFASHSHHYWPDVTREAQLQYWDDCAKHVDDKWSYIFSEKVPHAQKLIAANLNLSRHDSLVFAQSTHEFVMRLLSSLDWTKKIRVLTTDSEFYSFDRQVNRLSEMSQFEIVKVPTLPFDTFHKRFEAAMNDGAWNMIFLSHAFFNSSFVCDVHRLAKAAPRDVMFVIDGYHSFMAVPTSLREIEDRVFYLAGSYKYAQGGEGACFLAVPAGTKHRPFYTGWFAELSKLHAVSGGVGYPHDALQYAGSTMDFTALYRLIATLDKFAYEGISVAKIHAHVQKMQKLFMNELAAISHPLINAKNLLQHSWDSQGHFLTFTLPDQEATSAFVKELRGRGVHTDSRSNRLRFGFGMYQDETEVKELVKRLK
jgi:Selenocysteine lyase